MKKHARTRNAGTWNSAGDYFMRGNIVIRIRRKNEFNRYWAFIVTLAVVFGAFSLTVKKSRDK